MAVTTTNMAATRDEHGRFVFDGANPQVFDGRMLC